MTLRYMQLIAAASVLPLTLSIASADTFNKKTKLSFSQPIHVPGTTLRQVPISSSWSIRKGAEISSRS